jgi:hypothetical protein
VLLTVAVVPHAVGMTVFAKTGVRRGHTLRAWIFNSLPPSR